MRSERIKKLLSYMLTALLAFAMGVFALASVIRPQPMEVSQLDLSDVPDGHYIGVCQNKLLFAVVGVDVREHEFSSVDVLYHKAAYMEQAELTADMALAGQTLQVDAISGATLTRDTVLKAIENAVAAPVAADD